MYVYLSLENMFRCPFQQEANLLNPWENEDSQANVLLSEHTGFLIELHGFSSRTATTGGS